MQRSQFNQRGKGSNARIGALGPHPSLMRSFALPHFSQMYLRSLARAEGAKHVVEDTGALRKQKHWEDAFF